MKKSKMKIIAFSGSPRKNGNTGLLLKEAVKGIEDEGLEVLTFNLNLMNIRPCQGCGGCNKTGECIYKDDMVQVSDAIRSAHRIILASPVYFHSVSAQAKVMIDRCQSFWNEKYILKKPVQGGKFGRKGLLFLAGGMKKEIGMKCAESCATAFFRTVSVSEHNSFHYPDIDEKGAIVKHPTALKEAYEAGRRLVKMK